MDMKGRADMQEVSEIQAEDLGSRRKTTTPAALRSVRTSSSLSRIIRLVLQGVILNSVRLLIQCAEIC